MDCIGGRYIYIHAISDTYINGKVSFTSVTVDSLDIEAIFNLDPSLVSKRLFVKMIQNFEKNSADSTYGATLVKYTADGVPFDILESGGFLSGSNLSPLGMYEKLVNPSLGASFSTEMPLLLIEALLVGAIELPVVALLYLLMGPITH